MRNVSLRPRRPLRDTIALLAAFLVLWGCRSGEPVEHPVVIGDASAFEFPLELWDRGVEGEAVVRLRVTSAGAVDSAVIHRSSGQPAFDEAAIAGALELRFDPAREGDRPVAAWVRLPIRFTREGEAGEARVGSPGLTDSERSQEPAGSDGDAAAEPSSAAGSSDGWSETRSGS